MSITQQIILVAAGAVATMLTRFIPFILFRPGKPTPKYILYLGKVLPASVFALLVIYCLRNIVQLGKAGGFIGSGGFIVPEGGIVPGGFIISDDALAQIIGVAITILVHAWRKNLMWSIAAGTIAYMILIRI